MKRPRILLLIAVALLFALPFLWSLLDLAADWLFFQETGYIPVFTKTLFVKIGLGAAFGLLLFVFVVVNAEIARRAAFPQRDLFFIQGAPGPFTTGSADRLLKLLMPAAAALFGLMAGQWASHQWQDFLLFQHGERMGMADPVLGSDIGFYLFDLSFIEALIGFIGFMLFLTAATTALVYFLRGGIAMSERGFSIKRPVIRHLAVLIGLILLNMAVGFYLDTFRLLFSDSGVIYGAGYTDVYARLPIYRILTIASAIAAVMLVIGTWRGSWLLALAPPVLVGVLYVVGVMLYPSGLQQFKVAPNELALETPFITHNIRFTRMGFDLDKIEVKPFDVDYTLSSRDIERQRGNDR